MEKFCKIFESKEYGQILVKKDTNENCEPQVSVKFIPKGLGVCGPDFSFTDKDESVAWKKVDKLFDQITMSEAEKLAANIVEFSCGLAS